MINPVYSITPFTLLDYPGKTACIIWFAGCNMRCSYCYNPDIVRGKGKFSLPYVFDFLQSRSGLLDGVVLSGGECTVYKGLDLFAAAVKAKGLLVKIDTNGSNPKMLRRLIDGRLADYIALDFKAPFNKYKQVTGSALYSSFIASLDMLLASSVPFEVRTTVHSGLLSETDIAEMALLLEAKKYPGAWYIQYALVNTPTLGSLTAPTARIRVERLSSCIPVVERN